MTPHGFAVLCALSVLFKENRATEWASHGFAVLFMISNEIHRLHPTRICCALHDYQGNSQIAPHTHSLCSVLFQENWSTDCAPHGFAVLCALFLFKKIGHRLRPTRICCALCSVLFQENRATESPTRIRRALEISNEIHRLRPTRICCALCSVCSFPSKSGHRVGLTRIRCALHDFKRNPQIAPHTDLLGSPCLSRKFTESAPHAFAVLCSFSRKSGHRLRPTRICCALCSVLFQENRATESPTRIRRALQISNEIHRLRPTRICCALHDYQGNSQIELHTDFLCSVCSFPHTYSLRSS